MQIYSTMILTGTMSFRGFSNRTRILSNIHKNSDIQWWFMPRNNKRYLAMLSPFTKWQGRVTVLMS